MKYECDPDESQKAAPKCDHHWVYNLSEGRSVGVCSLCRQVNWDDLEKDFIQERIKELQWCLDRFDHPVISNRLIGLIKERDKQF